MICSIANIIANLGTNLPTLAQYILNAAGNPALLCILGNYLLIHLHEAAEAGLNEGTSYRPNTISAMDFNGGPKTEELSRTTTTSMSCE